MTKRVVWRAGMLMIAAVVAGWECGVTLDGLAGGLVKGLASLAFFFPPDWSNFPNLVEPATLTIALAAAATPLGAMLAIPLGVAAAINISPAWLRAPARLVIAVERGLPEIVVLLLAVVAFGLGSLPAVIALIIGSAGMLAKLVADAIEDVPRSALDGIACVGATSWQVLRYAVLPEVLPSFAANTVFRFEVNIRASILLGAVGAGGLGYELITAMISLNYTRATTAILASLAVTFAAERLADAARKRLLEGTVLR